MAIIIPMALFFPFFGCDEPDEAGCLRSLDSPAQMIIEGERNGVAFSAEIEIGGGVGKMTFSAPDSLAGICVTCEGGVWNSSHGGITVAGISAELIGAPMLPFIEPGAAVSAEKLTDENGEARTLIITSSDAGAVEYLIDSKSGAPLRVVEKDTRGDVIMSFDIREYTAK